MSLELDATAPPRQFKNSDRDRYRDSPDNQYLAAFRKEDQMILVMVDLETGQLIRELRHQYPLERFEFLNEQTVLTVSKNPVTERKIYKVMHIPLGENYFEYYDQEGYAPLSAEEKARYGIID